MLELTVEDGVVVLPSSPSNKCREDMIASKMSEDQKDRCCGKGIIYK